jgi:hypothetical protein
MSPHFVKKQLAHTTLGFGTARLQPSRFPNMSVLRKVAPFSVLRPTVIAYREG